MKQFINVKRVFTVLIILLLLISCRVETDYRPLFDKDLSNADYDSSVWTFKNGILTATADQSIWTKVQYENFILDLEFKTDVNTNSGVVIYCTDKGNWIPSSIEIQIADDHHPEWQSYPEYWRCGSIYGHKGANEQLVVKKPGEWNRMIVTAKGQQIDIELNGKHIVSAKHYLKMNLQNHMLISHIGQQIQMEQRFRNGYQSRMRICQQKVILVCKGNMENLIFGLGIFN